MQYDLVIVGGGLVGAGLAASLAETSLKIALIDAKLPSNHDPRLFALNHSSCAFLQNLQLWEGLVEKAARIDSVHVSKQGTFGVVRLSASDADLEDLGHVIPAFHIETALNDRLLELKNVTIFRPAILTHLHQHQSTDGSVMTDVTVQMQGKEITLKTTLLIGADGVDSTVRRLLHIDSNEVDYQQTAIVTRTHLQRSHQHIAYERFNTHGAIAMLPLGEKEVATIWSADNQKAMALSALSDQDFVLALQKEFGYRLGRLVSVAKRHSFPLRMVCAAPSNIEGVILLGNAAHTLHPIAAQGFNLALYEVAVLAEALMQGRSIKNAELRDQIKSQRRVSMTVSHQLAELFQHDSMLMRNLLPIAMVGMDKSATLRRAFITRMLGRSGHAPRLLLSARDA